MNKCIILQPLLSDFQLTVYYIVYLVLYSDNFINELKESWHPAYRANRACLVLYIFNNLKRLSLLVTLSVTWLTNNSNDEFKLGNIFSTSIDYSNHASRSIPPLIYKIFIDSVRGSPISSNIRWASKFKATNFSNVNLWVSQS